MRIAVVAPPWYQVPPRRYGGIEQVVALLVDGLTTRGHDVVLVAAGRPGTRARRVLTSYAQPPSGRIGEALPEVVHAAFVRRALAGVDVDLVHDHSTAGPLLAACRDVPTVVTAHNDVGGEPGRVLRHLGDDVHVVAISRAQQRLAPDLDWLAVVHNGIDVDRYEYRDDKEGFALFLGRACAAKAPHLAIDAARAAGVPIVVGAKCVEPAEREYFRAEVAPRLGPDVQWLGEIGGRHRRELLARASCLLFPVSWEEPFGLVMVEAMASGTPVVALRRGAVEEVVEDGATGWVCDSPDELPAAVRRAGRLSSRACRDRVARCFSAQRMVEGYEAAYREALRRGGTASSGAGRLTRSRASSGT